MIVELLFLGNIIFSYPLVINVTNYVIESAIFSSMEYSELRKWLKNLSRTIVIATSLAISSAFYYYLPKIMGLAAVLLGTTVVMITPALLNNALVAETKCSRGVNYTLIVYAGIVTVFLAFFIIYTWASGGGH